MTLDVVLAGAMVCGATGSLVLGALGFRGVAVSILVGSDSPLIDHQKHYLRARRLFETSRIAFPWCALSVVVGVGGLVFTPEIANPSLRAVLGALLLACFVTPVFESVVFIVLAKALRWREESWCYYEDAVETGIFEDGERYRDVI